MSKEDSKPSGSHNEENSKLTHAPYVSSSDFKASYRGHCFCGLVVFELQGDPKANVFCHCRSCQRLHGAPSTLSSIYDKSNVRFPSGTENLVFFSPQERKGGYVVPCKLTCEKCHSPIGNEGNNMMLILPALIDFDNPDHSAGTQHEQSKDQEKGNDHFDKNGNEQGKNGQGKGEEEGRLPEAFKPTFHQYYETKIRHIQDDLPKFKYEKNNGPLNDAAVAYMKQSEAEKKGKRDAQDLKEDPPSHSKKQKAEK